MSNQVKIEKIPFTKFHDGMTRMELSQKTLHDIALALMAQAHNDQCAFEYQQYCYQLGVDFMGIWKSKPDPTPFDDLIS